VNIGNNFFKDIINKVMTDGVSLKWIVDLYGLNFIKLFDTQVLFGDEYLVIACNISDN